MSAKFSMPIQNPRYSGRYDPKLDGPFVFVPADHDRRWAQSNHQQTLERLKERGGMSWCEMVAIVGHRPWDAADQHVAKAEAERIVAARPSQSDEGTGT